jgi:hypothetical protein
MGDQASTGSLNPTSAALQSGFYAISTGPSLPLSIACEASLTASSEEDAFMVVNVCRVVPSIVMALPSIRRISPTQWSPSAFVAMLYPFVLHDTLHWSHV